MAKGPDAFRTISEAAAEIGVGQHVLRFWETRFTFLRPMKRTGGRRFYRPADMALLHTVRRLLHDEGYSIKAVQKLHRDVGLKSLVQAPSGAAVAPARPAKVGRESVAPPAAADELAQSLAQSLAALQAAKSRLDALLASS